MPTFKALGLDDYIEVVVGREDVEQVKPDPELYLSAGTTIKLYADTMFDY